MRRWRRTWGVLSAAVVTGLVLSGCAGPLRTVPAEIAEPGIDPDCLIGTWRQVEGWQRLTIDDGVFDIYFVENEVELTIADDGTATMSFDDARWIGTHPSLYSDVQVVYAGTGTLTYEATDGHFSQVSDFTGRIATVTVGDSEDVGPGSAGAEVDFTFRCSDTDLVMAVEGARVVYSRNRA